jgi:hypothetical protein
MGSYAELAPFLLTPSPLCLFFPCLKQKDKKCTEKKFVNKSDQVAYWA